MEGRECYRIFAEFALIIIIHMYIYIAQTSIWIYSVAPIILLPTQMNRMDWL